MKDHTTQRPGAVTGAPPGSAPSLPPETDLTGRALGDFQILRRLGQGGMGQVYLAEQISLKRKVAVKVLKSELAANSVSLQRFINEATAVARSTHANIVQIYAVGQESGVHFMALEYVEGRNLREYLEKKGPPEPLVALSIMRQVAAGLQRAHELGIIHRDIKPENVLLTRKGEAKVADFGLSRCFTDEGPLNLTRTGISMGTPLYMSPEQVECKPLDHRTDIYSFGVTCYHLLAGQPPFRGQSPVEVAIQHVQGQPVPLRSIRPDLPAELCALVHRMLAKKPEERVQTCREITKELVRLRDALVGVSATSPILSTGPRSAPNSDLTGTQILPRGPRGGRRRMLVAATILFGLLGGLLAGRLWQNRFVGAVASADPLPMPHAQAERERELHKLVAEYAQPQDALQALAGLKHAIELGLILLKENRLGEADQLFAELSRPDQKTAPYRVLGELGHAMALAFQDQPAESNQQFIRALRRAKNDKAFRWINTPAVREMIALALEHNHENAPASFPPGLEYLRHPPRAKAKVNQSKQS